jgi:hypothetical protein
LPGSWSVSVAVTVCGLPAAGAIARVAARVRGRPPVHREAASRVYAL